MEEDDEGEFEEAIKQRQIDEPSPVNKEHLHPKQPPRHSKCGLLCTGKEQLTKDYLRFIYYRKSVLNLRKRIFHVHLSRCSTDLR